MTTVPNMFTPSYGSTRTERVFAGNTDIKELASRIEFFGEKIIDMELRYGLKINELEERIDALECQPPPINGGPEYQKVLKEFTSNQ